LGERQDAIAVERGLEGEVEAGKRLDRGEAAHAQRHLDAAVLAQRQFLGEQDVDGLERADLAALEPRTIWSRPSSARGIFRPTRSWRMRSSVEAFSSASAPWAALLRQAAADGVVELQRARRPDRRPG
jgi:hypothetical protein